MGATWAAPGDPASPTAPDTSSTGDARAERDRFEARKPREPVREADHACVHRPAKIGRQLLERALELIDGEVRRTGRDRNGAWLESVLGAELAERAKRAAEIDAAANAPSDEPPRAAGGTPRGRRIALTAGWIVPVAVR